MRLGFPFSEPALRAETTCRILRIAGFCFVFQEFSAIIEYAAIYLLLAGSR